MLSIRQLFKHFNSHTREGVTCVRFRGQGLYFHFNSHTREGVTNCFSRNCYIIRNFNSHTREGVTISPAAATLRIVGFQLTHPWGCDFFRIVKGQHQNNFNSHTREGVTSNIRIYAHMQEISTHTPVRVWRALDVQRGKNRNFNSHTREGVTTSHIILICGKTKFQLTHPWGCDVHFME